MARVGLITAEADENVVALAEALQQGGHEVLWVDTSGFDAANTFGWHEGACSYRGQGLEDVRAFFLRSIMSAVPAGYLEAGAHVLHADWFEDYQVARDRHGFWLSWLHILAGQGKALVNPPVLATMEALKPLQLSWLRRAGVRLPRTLITNSPAEVRAFHAAVGPVVFKPVLGGAHCQRLDEEAIARLHELVDTPVIFQEYVPGDNVRVTMLEGRVLSACRVAGDEVDFRAGEAFRQGLEPMTELALPPEVQDMCRRAMEACQLVFSGIDLMRTRDGEYVLLECNARPAWRHVERGTGAPITAALAEFLAGR